MRDFLDMLAQNAKETVLKAYYENAHSAVKVPVSMKKSIMEKTTAAVITEVKGASPSLGTIRESFAPENIASAMEKGGAAGISVLTEPKHFHGSLSYLTKVREAVQLPILMKDIVVSASQVEAASKMGANAVLLILELFNRGYSECSVYEMIRKAHNENLEVLLEVHNRAEFRRALETEADLIGINNRNLGTLKVDLYTTKRILSKHGADGRVVVSESGICSPEDIRFLKSCGANAFLVGSAVMLADDVEAKVKEFVYAL